jgi:ABC-type ATPase with predicted acetyltransferase domain
MRKTYRLELRSEISKSFRCTKAANSVDIDVEKKAKHEFLVDADVESDYNVGLIVGASGSGKTTLARHIYGENCFSEVLDLSRPVIDQFPEQYSYDECAATLAGVGLTAVVCWVRPAVTLSNGQRARAELALQMARQSSSGEVSVFDEWTSVVDRTVAKVMSHCIQKHARKAHKKVVLLSCHYDVIDWLNPCWVIDCNKQQFIDRRLLCRDFERDEKLKFELREVDKRTWKFFSKYHYLSDILPGGSILTYGVFHDDEQVGFQCFANYVPHVDKSKPMQMHSNRTVIHPDYAGFGLGILTINESAKLVEAKGYDVRAKFSSTPIYLSMKKQPCWKLVAIDRKIKMNKGSSVRQTGFREEVKTYSFKFVRNDSR